MELKTVLDFIPLFGKEILFRDNRGIMTNKEFVTMILVGITEDKVLLRQGNVITQWYSIGKFETKFDYKTKD